MEEHSIAGLSREELERLEDYTDWTLTDCPD